MLSGDKATALSAALQDPPLGAKDMGARDLNSKTVMSVLDAVNEGDVDCIIAKLADKG